MASPAIDYEQRASMLPRMRSAAGPGYRKQEMEGRPMIFYVGMDDVHHARHLPRTFISVNRLRQRKSDFHPNHWIMDSGAFTEISTHGRWTTTVEEYAAQIERWRGCGTMLAAVAQDLMCEPFIIEKSGMTVAEHQEITITRYVHLRALTDVLIMPVLQGFKPDDYVRHADQYGAELTEGQWTGVGSVCKRNTDPRVIEFILRKIKTARPDLRLHGFGLKLTALKHPRIRALLHSADSMAWSFHARKQGRNAHDWREAERFVARIEREQVCMKDFALT